MNTTGVQAVRAALIAQGLAGGTTGWPIHVGFRPNTPDRVVVIYPAAGLAPEQTAGGMKRQPGVQIVVRSEVNRGDIAVDKAGDIIRQLNRASVEGFSLFIATQSSAVAINLDNERPMFAVNFRAMEE